MFEIGKKYDIRVFEDGLDDENGITTYPERTVLSVEGTLIKITDGNNEVIINTASPAFVGAVLSRRQ